MNRIKQTEFFYLQHWSGSNKLKTEAKYREGRCMRNNTKFCEQEMSIQILYAHCEKLRAYFNLEIILISVIVFSFKNSLVT